MKKYYIIAIILVVVIGAYFLVNHKKSPALTSTSSNPSANQNTTSPSTAVTPTPTTSTGIVNVADWKTYQSDKYGIEFKYPSDWTIQDDGNGLGLEPSKVQCADCGVGLIILKSDAKVPQNLNDFLSTFPQAQKPNNIITSETVTVAGQNAYHLISEYNTALEQIVFFRNGFEYTIQNNYPAKGTIGYEAVDVTHGVAQTFKFIK